ncbi:Uncharacterised protein [Mycobacterium tuberculosis]|nr:Uncharacterised protein [Mycobacterium tuberculosis]
MVVEGIDTTRTAIFFSASSFCAASASCTSEPVAMMTAAVFLLFRPTASGSDST